MHQHRIEPMEKRQANSVSVEKATDLVGAAVPESSMPWISPPFGVVFDRELERKAFAGNVAPFACSVKSVYTDGALPRSKTCGA
jgi:hypothetical protein